MEETEGRDLEIHEEGEGRDLEIHEEGEGRDLEIQNEEGEGRDLEKEKGKEEGEEIDWGNKDEIRENFMKLHEVQKDNPDEAKVTAFYDNWSKGGHYDKHFAGRFDAPIYCAEALKRRLAGKTNVDILDVGAGTGVVGEELHKQGFTQIDAVEPSSGMVEKAREREVYNNVHQQYFTDKNDYLQSDTYDVIVCSGAIGPGHMPPSSLTEFVRIVKSGGFVVITVYKDGLQEADNQPVTVRELEWSGQWTCLEHHHFNNYYFTKEPGEAFIFKVTKQ